MLILDIRIIKSGSLSAHLYQRPLWGELQLRSNVAVALVLLWFLCRIDFTPMHNGTKTGL